MTHKVKVVCAKCNNGWMSSIEGRAAPLITSMMHDKYQGILTVADQGLLSTWSCLTAMMVQLGDPRTALTLPVQYQALMDTGATPPGMCVRLARVSGHTGTASHHIVQRHQRIHNPVPATWAEVNAAHTTIIVHDVAFQVFTWRGYDGQGTDLKLPFIPRAPAGVMTPIISPTTPLLAWPPPQRIPMNRLHRFVVPDM